jgi:hypothetical protein
VIPFVVGEVGWVLPAFHDEERRPSLCLQGFSRQFLYEVG